MKKELLWAIGFVIALICVLTSCDNSSAQNNNENATHTHEYGEWIVTSETTCAHNGLKKQICSCGDVVYDTIFADGHTPDPENICSVCNQLCVPMSDAERNSANNVFYVDNRRIDYNENKDRFEFTFTLLDEEEYKLSVPTFVDIRIENDNDVVVYQNTILVTASDYKNNIATIYINSSDIKGDYEKYGDFYYKIYNPDYFSFDEFNLSLFDLPLKATTLTIPSVPATYHDTRFSGYNSSVKITNITYKMNDDDMIIYFSGEKTYHQNGNNYSSTCWVGYKIYDSEGVVVASGNFVSNALCVGDKFRDETETVYNLKIGEVYTLELLNVY